MLFAVGSACFATGSFPSYATAVGVTPDNLTYFIGSIFFTLAALLQYDEATRAPTSLGGARQSGLGRLLVVQHHRIDWWACLIQFVGTLWFNRTTLSALVVGLGASSARHPVWRPDALGSVCFLVSSWLAWAEECHGAFAWRPSRLSWWITFLNLVGSVAFGVSAVASYVEPNGQLVSLASDELGNVRGCRVFPGRGRAPLARADGSGPQCRPGRSVARSRVSRITEPAEGGMSHAGAERSRLVGMSVRLQWIAIDAADPERIGRWWADVLGWRTRRRGW